MVVFYTFQEEITYFSVLHKKIFLIIKFMLNIPYLLDCFIYNGIIVLFGGIDLEK